MDHLCEAVKQADLLNQFLTRQVLFPPLPGLSVVAHLNQLNSEGFPVSKTGDWANIGKLGNDRMVGKAGMALP